MSRFDAIVIGGGSAGLAFAKEAARRDASVLLIERARLGGTCVNHGCVPKKMMWSVADVMHTQRNMAKHSIFPEPIQADLGVLADMRKDCIDDIVESFQDGLEDAGVTHITGDARLTDKGVTIDGETYESERIIIATGTRPAPLDLEGDALMDVSTDVFQWRSVPARLIVIGGGYIGCEMSAIFCAFGAKVTLVSDGDAVLTEFSPASQRIAEENLRSMGVDIVLGCKPASVVTEENGLCVTLDDGRHLSADKVLNATGRTPHLEVFGETDLPEQEGNGPLKIDDHFRTSRAGIYAVGDVANRLPLTPVAREDGKTLARQLFGEPDAKPVDLSHVATTAFVMPPIGEVGQTEDVSDLTRFTAMESLIETDDQAEAWALTRDGTGGLAGVTVVGHAAAEAISWAAQAVIASPDRKTMDRGVSVHPSKAEEPLGSDS